MASPFAALWAAAQPAFDRVLGEPVRIEPQAGGRKSRYVVGGADTGAPSFVVVGIFRGETLVTRMMGAGANSQENPDVVVNQTTVDFDAALFADPASTPQEGTMLTLLDRPAPNRYRVAAVKPDRTARVWCVVTGPVS